MRIVFTSIAIALVASEALAGPRLAPADETAAFRAAGFKRVAGKWQACGDPGSLSYQPGNINTARDINGDGLLDAVISEGSVACFGQSEVGYSLVSKQANGSWRLIASGQGMPKFLPRRAAKGWPDMEIGGPGFCFPVERWNGRKYILNRHQYEGRPCT